MTEGQALAARQVVDGDFAGVFASRFACCVCAGRVAFKILAQVGREEEFEVCLGWISWWAWGVGIALFDLPLAGFFLLHQSKNREMEREGWTRKKAFTSMAFDPLRSTSSVVRCFSMPTSSHMLGPGFLCVTSIFLSGRCKACLFLFVVLL